MAELKRSLNLLELLSFFDKTSGL